MTTLILSAALREQIAGQALAAMPRECCGLIEGKRDGDVVRIVALHPANNLAADTDRFEIDPVDHFHAIRVARANGHEIVGCYHSHPNGRAEPSARDAEGAWDESFIWLIAAVSGTAVSVGGFRRLANNWQRLDLQEITESAA
ncbi:MAG TPA: M67 family metallopeptidase [Rhizomicrobium sp.]